MKEIMNLNCLKILIILVLKNSKKIINVLLIMLWVHLISLLIHADINCTNKFSISLYSYLNVVLMQLATNDNNVLIRNNNNAIMIII